MKTTKKQALEAYDSFYAVFRNHNGGTREENVKAASWCLRRLKEEAAKVAELTANPGAALRADGWLWGAITEAIPARLAKFEADYFPAGTEDGK